MYVQDTFVPRMIYDLSANFFARSDLANLPLLFIADQWSELPNMSNKRGDFSAAIVGGKIVVVGGIGKLTSSHRLLNTVHLSMSWGF